VYSLDAIQTNNKSVAGLQKEEEPYKEMHTFFPPPKLENI
jgi:hypothetical protein